MGRPKEHDFKAKTKKQIEELASSMCAFPGCHKLTSGAKSNRKGRANIGVACHIKAASPNGPRFDSSQSPEERSSASNGIWMCQSHSALIDSDQTNYTVETLIAWQAKSHERSNQLINTRLYTEEEHKIEANDFVVSTLTKYIRNEGNVLKTPISAILSAQAEELDQLDPRFKVNISADQNQVTHTLEAQAAGIELELSVSGFPADSKLESDIINFIERGDSVTLDANRISISGSPLINHYQEEMRAGNGQLVLGTKQGSTETEIIAFNQNSEKTLHLYTSNVQLGTRYITITGSSSDNIFSTKIEIDSNTGMSKFNFTYNFSSWSGIDLFQLPYFERHKAAADIVKTGSLKVHTTSPILGAISTFDLAQQDQNTTNISSTYSNSIIKLNIIKEFLSAIGITALTIKKMHFSDSTDKLLLRYTPILKSPKPIHVRPNEKIGEGTVSEAEYGKLASRRTPDRVHIKAQKVGEKFEVLGNTLHAPPIHLQYKNALIAFYTDVNSRELKFDIYTDAETACTAEIARDFEWIWLD